MVWHSEEVNVRIYLAAIVMAIAYGLSSIAAEESMPPHPAVGQKLVPQDVDWDHPLYQTSFDDPAVLKDWCLEGGKSMSLADGKLVLESQDISPPSSSKDHLVCWLTKEVPADFLLEFSMRPRNRKDGLNIIFFNARGIHDESVFDPSLQSRDGVFTQYHSGDIKNYHVSYWASSLEKGPRGHANIRKNPGFHLVAMGNDLVATAPPDVFQTVRLYKRGGTIRVMIDDVVEVAYDDEGKTYGPVLTNSGWIGLRQMGRTVRCEYNHLKIWALKPAIGNTTTPVVWPPEYMRELPADYLGRLHASLEDTR